MITLDIDKKLHGATSTAPTSVSTCTTKLPTIAYHSTARVDTFWLYCLTHPFMF